MIHLQVNLISSYLLLIIPLYWFKKKKKPQANCCVKKLWTVIAKVETFKFSPKLDYIRRDLSNICQNIMTKCLVIQANGQRQTGVLKVFTWPTFLISRVIKTGRINTGAEWMWIMLIWISHDLLLKTFFLSNSRL